MINIYRVIIMKILNINITPNYYFILIEVREGGGEGSGGERAYNGRRGRREGWHPLVHVHTRYQYTPVAV